MDVKCHSFKVDVYFHTLAIHNSYLLDQKHVFLCGNHDIACMAFLGLSPFDLLTEKEAMGTQSNFRPLRGEVLWDGPQSITRTMHLQVEELGFCLWHTFFEYSSQHILL